jgi:hypothetical protein
LPSLCLPITGWVVPELLLPFYALHLGIKTFELLGGDSDNVEMVNYMGPAIKRSHAFPRAYKPVIKNSILADELKACLNNKREIKHLDKLNELMVTHFGTRWQTLEDTKTLLQQKMVW